MAKWDVVVLAVVALVLLLVVIGVLVVAAVMILVAVPRADCGAGVIVPVIWRHTATWVFARSPTGRLSLSLTATGSSNPGVRPEDLRAQTFYVTLPPRTSLGPLNAKKQVSTRASFDRQTVSLHENCVTVSLARLMFSPPMKYLARTCRDR